MHRLYSMHSSTLCIMFFRGEKTFKLELNIYVKCESESLLIVVDRHL